jgi:brefeldin A-inhibited guanine nucleotide-exchange protein
MKKSGGNTLPSPTKEQTGLPFNQDACFTKCIT